MSRGPPEGALPRCGAGDLRAEEREGGPEVPKHLMDMSLMTQIHPRHGQRDTGSAQRRTATIPPGLISDRERATSRTRIRSSERGTGRPVLALWAIDMWPIGEQAGRSQTAPPRLRMTITTGYYLAVSEIHR